MKHKIYRNILIVLLSLLPLSIGIYTLITHKKIFFSKFSGYSVTHNHLNLPASIIESLAYFLIAFVILLLLSDKKMTNLLIQILVVISLVLFLSSSFFNN